MARKKITVNSLILNNIDTTTMENTSVVDLTLIITIDLEFKGSKDYDLSKLLDGLTGEEKRSRQLELIKFIDYVKKMKGQGISKATRVEKFSRWVKHANSIDTSLSISDEKIVIEIHKIILKRHNDGKLAYRTYNNLRKQFRIILRDCFSVNKNDFEKWFPALKNRSGELFGATINNEKGDAKAFSDNDFKLIVTMLLHYARELQRRYLAGETHEQLKNKPPTFLYRDLSHSLNTHKILSKINIAKFLCNRSTIYYMLSFIAITGANLSPLLRAKRRDLVISKGDRDLLTIRITDKRKKKKDTPKVYLMKKYQEKLYTEILNYSKSLDPDDDALLFPYLEDDGAFKSFNSGEVSSAIQTYKTQGPIGEFGEILSPTPMKLRDSHGQQFDDIDNRAAALGNSPQTAAKHYSDGNSEQNTDELQVAMNAYTLSLLSGDELSTIHKQVQSDNDIKIIDHNSAVELLKAKFATKTSTGGICGNATTSNEAEKYYRRLNKLNLINEKEISCNNILACFTCEHHAFVDEEEQIYILLSFHQFLIDSLHMNEAGGLFGSKPLINDAIDEIYWMKENKFNTKFVTNAERKIKYQGIHPIWSFE
ncbi:hypothetical protein [Pseudoalteromonas agarivorans]|uniref:Uncharacterized protein n=1 Tax=Pseudoalteromonas agarivorans TaxID=176102 RepID=A0AAD0TZH4_9GAMM|nr:hypothetical protein [Pseudoalteromonas agarivorans]AYM86866.1 hypothetical protein D9T18_09170 [Pseudoalteromonas agarivorans]